MKTSPRKSPASKISKKPAPPKKKAPSVRTASLDKAIKDYEEAVRLFMKKDFAKAAHLFESIINDYPTEREVGDRSRMYLSVCKQQTASTAPKPKTLEDLYLHGVVAANDGRLDEAAELFDRMIKSDSANDRGYYALSAVCTLKGDRGGAIANLAKSIELNPRSRIQALNDADFDTLREDAEFMALLGKAPEGSA